MAEGAPRAGTGIERGDTGLSRADNARWRWTLVIGIAAVAWLGMTFKPVVQNDGIFYFAYLHAIVIQHDLDFTSEYSAASREGKHPDPLLVTRSASGRPADAFPVGPALFGLPLYLVAVTIAGPDLPQFGPPYATAFCLSSLLAGLLALALCFRITAAVTGSDRSAVIGVAAAALTTPFVYYLSYEPSYSHTFSAFASAAFVYWWWRTGEGRSGVEWLVLGLLGGLMGMTRFQDGALLLIALIDLPRARWMALWAVPGALVGFSPQLLVDHVQFGSWLPYRSAAEALRPLPGHYLDVLLSSHHGLLAWHPGILGAAAGFVFVRDRRLRLAFLVALAVETLIDGAAPDWDGGFAFGGRRFLVLTPFFALGYGALATRLRRVPALAGLSLLAAWNVVLMANLTYVIIDKQDPGYLGLLSGQLQALRYVPREFAQGAVVRALALWPLLHQRPDVLLGVGLLALEAGCVALALAAAVRGRLGRGCSTADASA